MTGAYYPNLVQVFYNNAKDVDGKIDSRVKEVDIIIDNDTWLQVSGIKVEGRLSHLPDCSQNRLTRKTDMFKDCMRYHGRYKKGKGFLFKWLNKEEKIVAHIIGHILIPGKENKVACSKAYQIGKATLTCIGLKRTALGWIFGDELDPIKGRGELPDSDNEQELPPPNSEFERLVANRINKVFKRTNVMKDSLMDLNEKMDEIIKHYVESSTSTEGFESEEVDETSEEDSEELSETE
ncbi:hypothetical protein V8G54_004405 [Vigna mungo]|uniref:Uncharacterized protein n=1 Tax=Vigna mungo TaxID=3915 RepID=A0AAQ3SF60_VIGMU